MASGSSAGQRERPPALISPRPQDTGDFEALHFRIVPAGALIAVDSYVRVDFVKRERRGYTGVCLSAAVRMYVKLKSEDTCAAQPAADVEPGARWSRHTAASSRMPSVTRHLLTLALDAGFRSLAPFNRSFKDHFGITPSEYRHKLEDSN